jgi:HK97 family phage major capsid protein
MDIVKPLQARNVMVAAGAKFLTGLVGDVQYPVMSKVACSWEGETRETPESEITFSNVKLTPHRLTCVIPISKQFLVQDSVGAENAIREEIINAINAKLEATIFGDEEEGTIIPYGFFKGGSSGTIVNNYSALVNFEASVEEANVTGDMKYILSPKAKAGFRGMAKSANSPQLVYESGEVDGTPALVTTHLENDRLVYGDFSQYIIAQWGSLDILVDSYTLASKGMVRLVVTGYFDLKPLRPEAFKAGALTD